MSRFIVAGAVCLLGFLLTGCPDIYDTVKDVEFEGFGFVSRPARDPFRDSPVLFPQDWDSRPKAPKSVKVDDPVLAKALLAKKGRTGSTAKSTFTVTEGPYGPLVARWLDSHRRRVDRSGSICPICLSSSCTGIPCWAGAPGVPLPADREAWKRFWRTRGFRRGNPRNIPRQLRDPTVR
ncbi:MAG: hypothetical protein ACYTHM_08300 [Planctomycetota bacterium]|jgi:hypothetical protein